MSNLMPSDIKDEVEHVLENMTIYTRGRSFLTAYQILERLTSTTRDRLIAERGTPGLGAGQYYAAASVVSDAAEMVSGIEIAFLETSSLSVRLANGNDITPGNENVGLYRKN
ncbi:hypothetical protein ACFL3Q_05610 [Planctomycetota bacterium]